MELQKFVQLLKRSTYILIGVPLFAIGITYFFVHTLPDVYFSKATMATGLVQQSEQLILENNQSDQQESKINQQFSNIIQMMQLKKVIEHVSYRLIIHDLATNSPFHPKNKLLNELNSNAKAHALATYSELNNTNESLQPNTDDHKGLQKLLEALGYDELSLKKKLVIYRINSSDYISIEYESASPDQSAFVVNAVTEETIKYYSGMIKKSRLGSVLFLDSILKQKKAEMDNNILQLKNYKIDNHVLNLNEQAKSYFALLADFETKRELAKKDIDAYTGALANIDSKFNPKERKYLESKLTTINQDIVATKDNLRQLNNDYIKSNYDTRLKAKVDSVKDLLVFQINQSNDQVINNPLAVKQNLVFEKVKLEVGLDLAKFSLNSLTNELARLNQRFDKLVPHEAVIQADEQAIDFASKDYIEVLKKYNQTALASTLSINLKTIEPALPGRKLASKKMLLMIMAGLVSFILSLVILFVLFYVDDSITTTKELANATTIACLGHLPLLTTSQLQLQDVWLDKSPASNRYKNLIRDVRFEIDTEMQDDKVLMISSINASEGKTIFAFSLAYAYATINKKILLIDGNFTNPSLTTISQAPYYLEDYLNSKISLQQFKTSQTVDVLGTYGADVSLLEITTKTIISVKMAELKTAYDMIIIELPALEYLNKAKEWIAFGDKLVAVFQAKQSITAAKQPYINYLISIKPKFMGWVLTKTFEANSKQKFK